jgi:hypothetical protein
LVPSFCRPEVIIRNDYNPGLYKARILIAELANLSGISGRNRIKVARPASALSKKIGPVGFYSEYSITSRRSTMLKFGSTCDVVICYWKKITMSLVNLRVGTMDGVAGTF